MKKFLVSRSSKSFLHKPQKSDMENVMRLNFKNLLTFLKDNVFIEFIEGGRILVNYQTRRMVQFGAWIVLVFALMIYFLFHAVKGDRGILAWSRLESKLVEKEQELSSIETQWNVLDQKVRKLGQTICSDLLEEQSIRILGFSHPGDVVLVDEK
jgi:cell division protein FtsB